VCLEEIIRNHSYFHKATRSSDLSRRNVLQRMGFGVATVALLPAARLYADDVSPVMKQLSEYMSAARTRELPEEVMEKTKQHVLDTFAAMVSGSQLAPGKAALNFARSYGGEKVATVVSSNVLCSPIEAAFSNAIQAHSDETDDSHTISGVHPGGATVSATLAAGEKFGISGAHFLRAVTLGYDVGPRVILVLGGPDYQTASHNSVHSIGALFSAASAAGCAAGLSAEQMRWVLDYAAQQSAGIAAWVHDTQHIEKAFVFAGGPSRSGITAALLVQGGFTGIDDVFSGSDNFFDAHPPAGNPAGLVNKLGEHYNVVETNIKKWSVGSPIQATLDALENLRKKHPFKADDVQQVIVRIETREAGVVDNRIMPDVCLQHLVGVMLLDTTVSFATAHDKARMQDPEVLRQRAKVQLIPDPELSRLMPKRVTIVDLVMKDGTKLNERVEAVRGTSDNPMSHNEVVAKAADLMTPVFGATQTKNLIDKVFSLEKIKNITELRPLLQHA
jgi:2-methylcitrate dehydratase PrpD